MAHLQDRRGDRRKGASGRSGQTDVAELIPARSAMRHSSRTPILHERQTSGAQTLALRTGPPMGAFSIPRRPTSAMNARYEVTDEGYTLRYGQAATADVKSSLHLAVRPHLQDVRAMLRLPLPEVGITAGCNFAALHVLLNVLSGLSRLMGASPKRTDSAFRAFVARWYPWRLEPGGSTFRQKRGTEALYDSFRTGFSHDLGLLLESGSVDDRGRLSSRFRITGRQLGVAKRRRCPSSC